MPRWATIVVALVMIAWGGFFTWTEVIDADPDQYSIKSDAVKQQFANCTGNFEQRQACAERISTSRQQLGFLVLCEKAAIILGPPLVLWWLMNWATRQRQAQPPRRAAAAGARRTGAPTAAGQRNQPVRRVRADDPAPRAPQREPEPLPERPADAPLFTGGRRQPIRRRDP
ncbi:MAG TPA: hypothetical protein VGG27_17455 [Magnetospirillaceae bacterium]|jgi:hypothetical protein